MGKLAGKVAVVTGASKGIGAAIAEDLAREGASVIVNYASSGEQAEALVKKIKAAGGAAKAVQADVSKPADAKAVVKAAVSEFGKLDILVNNAGVYEFAPLESITEKHFDRMFDLNVRGLIFATQAAVAAFGDSGGSVINIGSVASSLASPTASVYSATKGAVDVITKSLAAELGPKNIRVNGVLPGPVVTEGAKLLPEFEPILASTLPRTPLDFRRHPFLGRMRCYAF
ncbi:MAG: SDR family NAD(P)-dependent oxidoreductase [Ignavibacteriota bacterium]